MFSSKYCTVFNQNNFLIWTIKYNNLYASFNDSNNLFQIRIINYII